MLQVKTKSFDIVYAVVKEKELESQGALQIDEENLDILSGYCDVIDNIIEECFGESVTVEVTKDRLVCIDIVLSSFVYEKRFKPVAYIELMKRSAVIRFTKTGECSVKMSMVFPSVYK